MDCLYYRRYGDATIMSHHILISPRDEDWVPKARAFARQLNLPVYILTQLIEQGETVPIETLIQDEGLEQYHHIVTVYLESILRREPGVVVIDESLAKQPANAALLKSCTPINF